MAAMLCSAAWPDRNLKDFQLIADAQAVHAEAFDGYLTLPERMRSRIPPEERALHLPWIDDIKSLKKFRRAVVLARKYQAPEIYHGIAGVDGDSLSLAQRAVDIDAELIVVCGVHSMAETAKLLNPSKTVLIPDMDAGCSLATSITPADIRLLRQRYPGAPVVCYVNTSAAVKAESDVCCTSANALHTVESLLEDTVTAGSCVASGPEKPCGLFHPQ